ncbi:hypothetical protein BDY21DRAFT_418356, partial [Lineolata rhizophorae]
MVLLLGHLASHSPPSTAHKLAKDQDSPLYAESRSGPCGKQKCDEQRPYAQYRSQGLDCEYKDRPTPILVLVLAMSRTLQKLDKLDNDVSEIKMMLALERD